MKADGERLSSGGQGDDRKWSTGGDKKWLSSGGQPHGRVEIKTERTERLEQHSTVEGGNEKPNQLSKSSLTHTHNATNTHTHHKHRYTYEYQYTHTQQYRSGPEYQPPQ